MSQDVPPLRGTSKEDKKAWKRTVHESKGSSFSFELSGWMDVPNVTYAADSVTLIINVSSDGKLSCGDPGCLAKGFGESSMTRAEYNAYKHACAHHRPRLDTIHPSAEAGPANKKPRRVVQSLLVQGSASSSSSSSSSSSAGGSPVFFQVVTKKKYAQQNAERTEAALAQ
jgi:hypothetical protein